MTSLGVLFLGMFCGFALFWAMNPLGVVIGAFAVGAALSAITCWFGKV